MKKMYVTGVHPEFDEAYKNFKNNSPILTSSDSVASVHNILWDKRNLEGVKLELEGGKDGTYRKYDEKRIATIPYIKSQLADLAEVWEIYREERENQGYSLPNESDMPADMLSKKLNLEASLNVHFEELQKINDRLKQFTEAEEKQSDDLVLKYGLLQSANLINNQISEIDGMKCSKINGVLCVNDPRAKYYGMAIPDYRRLAVHWREQENLRDEEELKKIQAEQTRRGLPLSTQFSSWGRVVKPEELPAFPEDFERHIDLKK